MKESNYKNYDELPLFLNAAMVAKVQMCIRDSTIVGAAAEHGSGMTLDRPALQEVMEAVLAGKVDVVLISSLDRIGPVSYTHLDVYKRQVAGR